MLSNGIKGWCMGILFSHFGDVDRKCTFCKIKVEADMKAGLGRELTQAE
jgi:hypothetical protein